MGQLMQGARLYGDIPADLVFVKYTEGGILVVDQTELEARRGLYHGLLISPGISASSGFSQFDFSGNADQMVAIPVESEQGRLIKEALRVAAIIREEVAAK
ncbi:hypothetical protein J4217_04775 [Candidatus Pacearchaeota archaeon]|nr:hypothetical protein [Candidatus Pacearchaeota archaeon]